MKVVIFAGGMGTRLMEETESRPKPMVEIAGKPILWHIMKFYEAQGFNEFVICLGYKGHMIKEYFLNYYLYNSDVTIELESNKLDVHYSNSETFKVSLIDTGLNTNTAGRLKKVKSYLNNERFMLTYGDGLSNVDLKSLLRVHEQSKNWVTLTTVQSPGRFGHIEILDDGRVGQFEEKPSENGMWINGGFFVMEPEIFNFLNDDVEQVQWEKGPLREIAKAGMLGAYKHSGFWKCMDAMRDRIELEELWNNGKADWKIW